MLATGSNTAITSPGTVLIGSTTTSGGNIGGITSPVTVTGNGADQLLVEDLADVTARIGALSAAQLKLGPAVVNYSGVANLALNLGSGGDQFNLNSTAAATPVTLNGGSGNDTLNLAGDSSSTRSTRLCREHDQYRF